MSKIKKTILLILLTIALTLAGLMCVESWVLYTITSHIENLYLAIACLIIVTGSSILIAVLGDLK